MYRPVSAVRVSIWDRAVGVIVQSRTRGVFAFEYDPSFLGSGIEISPLSMPLGRGVFSFPDLPRKSFRGLPPAFADALPDSFGNALVDAWMAREGVSRDSISPLDRLAYMGRRGVGALRFEPECGPAGEKPSAISMSELVETARRAVAGTFKPDDGALLRLLSLGTSAGGAQAKAVIGWNRDTGAFRSGQFDVPDGFEHWIVKFTPESDPDAGRREYDAFRKARLAGIDMSESTLVEIGGLEHFATKRFDRDGNRRHHVQTLSAMAGIPAGAGSGDYAQLFMTADALGLGYETMEEIFRRMAFNVAIGNIDDHAKNFSFMLREGGRWELAPAYDVVKTPLAASGPWSEWENVHALSIGGKRSGIARDDLLRVADRFGVGTAPAILDRVFDVA